MLTRDQILAAQDLRTEDVDVPEWGGTVRVSSLSAAARNAWEAGLRNKMDGALENASAKLAAVCLVGEDGKRLFSDDDVIVLGAKSAKALSRVVDAAMRLNGIGSAEVEAAVKN